MFVDKELIKSFGEAKEEAVIEGSIRNKLLKELADASLLQI